MIESILLVLVSACIVIGAVGMLRSVRKLDAAPKGHFIGWARVSLLGRQNFLGMAREVKEAGGTSYEVATLDGRAIRTSANAVHTIERVPFSVIEAEAVMIAQREKDIREYDERHQKHHREVETALDLHITCLRNYIGDALAAEDPEKARASLTAALDLDDEKNEQRFPF